MHSSRVGDLTLLQATLLGMRSATGVNKVHGVLKGRRITTLATAWDVVWVVVTGYMCHAERGSLQMTVATSGTASADGGRHQLTCGGFVDAPFFSC